MVQQSGDGEALSVAQFYLGLCPAGGNGRNRVPGNDDCIGVIERAYFRRNFQLNRPIVIDDRGKIQPHPIGPELNGDGSKSARSALNHRKGKLTPGKKRGLLSAQRSNGRLGKNLRDISRLQILQGQSDIQAKIVKEQVERIAAGQRRRE